MLEKEKVIQEQRTIEATRKNFLGGNGKIGCIVKHLGSEIIDQGDGSFSEYRTIPDFYNLDNDAEPSNSEELQNSIPYSGDANEPVGGGWKDQRNYRTDEPSLRMLGWVFDGLSRGLHLEIVYRVDKKELKVVFKGNVVFREVNGELLAYNPYDEWEMPLENLYNFAKTKEKSSTKQEKQDMSVAAESNKSSWLQKMKEKWGL